MLKDWQLFTQSLHDQHHLAKENTEYLATITDYLIVIYTPYTQIVIYIKNI